MFYGLKQCAIDLDKINAIWGKTGLFFGEISIQDAATNHAINNVTKKIVVPFVNKTRDAINARKQRAVVSQAAMPSADDPVARLEKLLTMLQKGLISESEFLEQKARILSSV